MGICQLMMAGSAFLRTWYVMPPCDVAWGAIQRCAWLVLYLFHDALNACTKLPAIDRRNRHLARDQLLLCSVLGDQVDIRDANPGESLLSSFGLKLQYTSLKQQSKYQNIKNAKKESSGNNLYCQPETPGDSFRSPMNMPEVKATQNQHEKESLRRTKVKMDLVLFWVTPETAIRNHYSSTHLQYPGENDHWKQTSKVFITSIWAPRELNWPARWVGGVAFPVNLCI